MYGSCYNSLESNGGGGFQRDFAISDIQSSPDRDDRVYASVRISIIYIITLPS